MLYDARAAEKARDLLSAFLVANLK